MNAILFNFFQVSSMWMTSREFIELERESSVMAWFLFRERAANELVKADRQN